MRVDLAGGTLDLWPFWAFLGGATTINIPISIYATVRVKPRKDSAICLHSPDLGLKTEHEDISSLLQDPNPQLALFQEVLSALPPPTGLELYSQSDSPIGGGLGGSSVLTATLLLALGKLRGERFQDWSLVELAHNIEARLLRKPTGTQDYVTSLWNTGFNLIRFSHRGPRVETLTLPGQAFQSRFSLVYTGKSHNSGINNWQVQRAIIDGDSHLLGVLRDLAEVSERLESDLRSGPSESYWDQGFVDLLRKETTLRTQLCEAFGSPEIDQVAVAAVGAGAHGIKICGAGGGGCVMVWSPPGARQAVEDACRKLPGVRVLAAAPLL